MITTETRENLNTVSAANDKGDKRLEYVMQKKSKIIAFFLWLFFGLIGAHNFYISENTESPQAAYCYFKLLISVLLITPVAIFAFVVLLAMWIVDLFLFWKKVDIFNEQLKQRLGFYDTTARDIVF